MPRTSHLYIHTYTYIHFYINYLKAFQYMLNTFIYVYINKTISYINQFYIFIYRERETERQRETDRQRDRGIDIDYIRYIIIICFDANIYLLIHIFYSINFYRPEIQ